MNCDHGELLYDELCAVNCALGIVRGVLCAVNCVRRIVRGELCHDELCAINCAGESCKIRTATKTTTKITLLSKILQ
jgi:hypothetical protein